MEDEYLGVYVLQVQFQVAAAEIAKDNLNAALQVTRQIMAGAPAGIAPMPADRMFAALQAFATATAMITRLFWPYPASKKPDGTPLSEDEERTRAWSIARGRALRKAFGGIGEASPLGKRGLRNALEHFDERLDDHLVRAEAGELPFFVMDRWTLADGLAVVRSDGVVATVMRKLDPTSGRFWVLDHEVDLEEMCTELARVGGLARDWLAQHEPGIRAAAEAKTITIVRMAGATPGEGRSDAPEATVSPVYQYTHLNEDVDVVALARAHNGSIDGHSFVRCRLIGPAVLGQGVDIVFDNLLFGLDQLWELEPGRRYVGGIPLHRSRIEACTFESIGFAALPDAIAPIRGLPAPEGDVTPDLQ